MSEYPRLRRSRIAMAIAATALMTTAATPAAAGLDPFIGEIAVLPFTFCPQNWVPADGRILVIQQNQALFSLFGDRYGGNGTTTFALPKIIPAMAAAAKDVGDSAPVPMRVCIAMQGVYPSPN